MTEEEELLTSLPMKEHMWGEDIFQAFKNLMEKTISSRVCKLCVILMAVFVTYVHYCCQFLCATPRVTLVFQYQLCIVLYKVYSVYL